MRDHALVEIFQTQAGVISYRQGIEAGLSAAEVRHRADSGAWLRVHRGIYRNALFPSTFRSRLWVGLLATGGLASHRSAAHLHGFEELAAPLQAEVVVAHGRWRAVPGVMVHQSTQIDRVDEDVIDAVRVTGRGRTVLDLGASMRARELGKIVDGLLRTEQLSQRDLWDVLVRHSVQGRVGCGPLRKVLEVRFGQERLALSDWSYVVANLLESAGLSRPRLEFRVHTHDGVFLAQVDLAYPESRLAIELDSVRWHHNLESFGSDRRRARQLTVDGWSVLQFTWEDYTKRPTQLIAQVSGILRRSAVA